MSSRIHKGLTARSVSAVATNIHHILLHLIAAVLTAVFSITRYRTVAYFVSTSSCIVHRFSSKDHRDGAVTSISTFFCLPSFCVM